MKSLPDQKASKSVIAAVHQVYRGDAAINAGVIKFTVFRDVFAKHTSTRCGTWEDVVGLLSATCEYSSKSSCQLIKLAAFADNRTDKGSLRSDDNMTEVYGIEGDYDGGQVTLAQAAAMLEVQGMEAYLYTTPSHASDKPRWRVLAPLSRGYAPAERAKFVALVNGILGGILSPESFVASQTYYFGRVRGIPYEFRRLQGVPVDDLDPELVGVYPTPKVENTPKLGLQSRDLDRRFTLAAVTDETIEDLRSALMGMNVKRSDERKLWVDVLESLASLKETPYRNAAHDLAHEFSKRCPKKYDAECLDATWDGMYPSRITYRSIFEWAQTDGWVNPRSARAVKGDGTHTARIDRTDAGNATLLANITAGNLRYVPERHIWLWWDGAKWGSDEYGIASQAHALKVAEWYHVKATELRKHADDNSLDANECKRIDKAAESLEKWATQCRNKRAIDSMLSLAKGDQRFTLPVDKIDRDPWLFGVENGVIDLRTGTLREAGRDDYVTRRSPLRFDPNAKAARWHQFIEEITAAPNSTIASGYSARRGLADYVQRALGYTMTGSTAEHKMFIAIGDGSNGKNVLLDTLQWVMGDYCQSIPPEALMATRYGADAERPSPTMATLAGSRAAIGSESKDGQKLDVALVKRHTGGGYMTARYMRENTFRFEITHKLWLMTNHKPALDHMDEALRGRLHLIPFDMRWNRPGHPERNLSLPDGDKELPEKLKMEAEGILAWLIAGAVAYAGRGLEPPEEVVRMTRSYFKDHDLLGRWVEDLCETCDPKLGGRASDLFESFQKWCDEEGTSDVIPHKQKAFSSMLMMRGIQKHTSKDGKRYGLRVLEQPSSNDG